MIKILITAEPSINENGTQAIRMIKVFLRFNFLIIENLFHFFIEIQFNHIN